MKKSILDDKLSNTPPTIAGGSGNSLILRTATLTILPLQLIFSVFLLLRGHNDPGGGFIGGLVASGAFSLYLYAFGVKALNDLFWFSPKDILSAGLLLGLAATLPSLMFGQAFFTALWLEFYVFGTKIKLSNVLVFDIGVYLTVIGTLMTMFTSIAEVGES